MKSKKPKPEISQSDQFIETARALGCDESAEAFDKKLKAIASAKLNAEPKKVKKK